ncbi:heme exporter protein CcmB [Porticoccaceae bacterium]|nr:heme exporter protein CcmB [Porticoccaceae bacterium]MDB4032460.1 heme exporter protein CcmB [Porticoccaceae bacterium]MDB4077226.1 heme exporter protein CcmB [Porticoccaceae bacterium]MDB4262624.1 heme exporter protein CcmB [Porticoccaceae bacterium]MDB4308732.1 heme exporter protein CcmB [Porticoccaceae bacterium]
MASGFSAYLRRDLLLAYRRRGEAASPLIFFVMVSTLIPLGITPESARLAEIAPGIIWVMALLATLLSTDSLFASDYQDGSLEQLLISPQLLAMPVLGKITAHWMVTGLPLTLASPLLGLMLSLPAEGYVPMMASLAIGTACLSLVGSVGAALTVSLRKGGLLLSLLVMPLYMPVIIFGSATVQSAIDGFAWSGPLAILGAMLAAAIALCPIAAAGALRLTSIN